MNIWDNMVQLFITCDQETGHVTSAEIGRYIVRVEPADFFFYMSIDEADKLVEDNLYNYKIELDGYKSKLVRIEPEPTTEEEILQGSDQTE